jgi:hypothetical protein
VVDEVLNLRRAQRRVRGNPSPGNAVVKVHQHLAQIEDDGFRTIHRRWFPVRFGVFTLTSAARALPET